jgi:hypothetical protein
MSKDDPTNAERQARFQAKRHKLAKQASSIPGLIGLLAHQVKGKSDAEIDKIIARVAARLRRAKQVKP